MRIKTYRQCLSYMLYVWQMPETYEIPLEFEQDARKDYAPVSK
jgi:hypothetical protein